MAVRHSKTSGIADGSDATKVRASNWNAAHHSPDFLVFVLDCGGAAPAVWTDQPAGLTEFLASPRNRCKVDLTNATTIRLTVRVTTAGASNAKLRLQYSTDEGTWLYMDHSAGPSVGIGTTGTKTGSVTLHSSARADVFLRVVGIDGNGTADPAFGHIMVTVT